MSATQRLAIVGGKVLVGGAGGFGADDGREATVLIKGERIARVDGGPPPEGAATIDASGLTLLPGMVDVHTHVPTPEALALYARLGVTSVRFAGSQLGVVAGLRAQVAAGALPGPRIFSCGPLLDEPPPAWPNSSMVVDGPADVPEVVARLADAEADALIVAQRVRPETLGAIVTAAHDRGLPVTGQTWTTSVREAVELGMDGVENTARLPEGPSLPPESVESYRSIGDRLARLVHLWETAPRGPIDETVALMASAGTDWAPELCSFAHWAGLTDAALAALPAWAWLTPEEQAAIPSSRGLTSEGWTDAERRATRAAIERMQSAGADFLAQGGHLAVGTDAHPGALFYHLELDFLRQAGLSPAQVLAAATLGGARALRREAELGSLVPGKLADLIVVGGDPRQDLSALQRVRHAVVGGRVVVRDGQLAATGDC